MSSSRSAMKKRDSPPSITPQRKHRKLLKDGSGTEVWPESIEKIFVQGLREYWSSPYATYSQSRGRSRWRNQFLVDYLNKQGIERTKKQVASHIQVLRNMWKGEQEFHLVAGGDELYTDNDSPVSASVKLEEGGSLIALDWEDEGLPSSNSVSPNFSPADSQSEFPPTPEQRPNLYPSDFGSVNPKVQSIHLDLAYPTPGINSPSISPQGDYIQQLPPYHDPTAFGLLYNPAGKYNVPSPLPPHIPTSPFSAAARSTRASLPDFAPQQPQPALNRHMSATPTHYRYLRNQVTSIYLQADGMTPFAVKVDALAHPAQVQPPFTLRIRLCMPSGSDARSPPNLQGFVSGVSLETVWSVNAKCITKVFGNGTLHSNEIGMLTVTNINVGTVNAALPDSTLSRCRWLDHNVSVHITQEIIVDDETLLFVVYELDRKNGGPMPSATLLGYQKYRAAEKGTTSQSQGQQVFASSGHGVGHPSLSPSPGGASMSPHAGPYARPASLQPALNPYALSPTPTTGASIRRQY